MAAAFLGGACTVLKNPAAYSMSLLFLKGRGRKVYRDLKFALERMVWHAADHQTLKVFGDITGPLLLASLPPDNRGACVFPGSPEFSPLLVHQVRLVQY